MPQARQSFGDIPIQTIAGVDTVGGIQSILIEHDYGMFMRSAQLVDAMMRDDRIAGVTSTRIGGLLASPLEVKPATSRAKAARVAKALKGDGEDDHGIWDRIFPAPVIRGLSKWGTMLNFGLAEIIWQTKAGEWTPRLKLWHPQFVFWDPGRKQYMLIAVEGVIPLPRIDENPEGDGKWVLWTPYGYQYGWLDAMVRSLADKYLMRQWDYRDWARYNERHGQPVVAGVVPESADLAVKEEFLDKLSTFGSDAAIAVPKAEGEEGFDIKMIEATARSFDSFDKFKTHLDTDIAVLLLGQNLTTEVSDGGSRAAAQIQNLVRIDKAIEDAGLAMCLRQQVLTWWARYNYGDSELAPRPEYQVAPPDDELKEATALKTMGDALTSLQTAGAPIDVRTILDRAGVPMISEEEQAAQEAIAAEEAAAIAAGQAGQDGDDGASESDGGAPGDVGKGGDEGASPGASGKKPPAKKALSTRELDPTIVKRYEFQGLPIAVENPAGSIRMWRDPGPDGGTIGTTTMLFDYGFIDGHTSGDDEELDAYIGPDENAADVHVVHQMAAPDFKRWDEDKVFLGFPDAASAKEAFLAHRNDVGAYGGMSVHPLGAFKRKLKRRTGSGKIRLVADRSAAALLDHRQTVAALVALSERHQQSVGLRADRPVNGTKRAKYYADAVATKAKRLAARALAVDLAGLKADIDAATSFDDLRVRLVARYKTMNPARLARIVEKARIMANLGGRLSVLKEV